MILLRQTYFLNLEQLLERFLHRVPARAEERARLGTPCPDSYHGVGVSGAGDSDDPPVSRLVGGLVGNGVGLKQREEGVFQRKKKEPVFVSDEVVDGPEPVCSESHFPNRVPKEFAIEGGCRDHIRFVFLIFEKNFFLNLETESCIRFLRKSNR